MKQKTEVKYLVFRKDGELLSRRPEKQQDAVSTLLGHDGHKWEIREVEDEWQLWVSVSSANAYGGSGEMSEWLDYSANSEQGVLDHIISKGGVHDAYAMTESEYDEFLKEL